MRYRVYKIRTPTSTSGLKIDFLENGVILDTRKDIIYRFYLPDQVSYFALPIQYRKMSSNAHLRDIVEQELICEHIFEIERLCQLSTKLMELYFEYFL